VFAIVCINLLFAYYFNSFLPILFCYWIWRVRLTITLTIKKMSRIQINPRKSIQH